MTIRINAHLKSLLTTLLLCSLLLAVPLAYAEDAPGSGEPVAPIGVTTLILLLGLGAVFAVGPNPLARGSYKGENGYQKGERPPGQSAPHDEI